MEVDGEIWAKECSCKEQKSLKRMFKASGIDPEQQKVRIEHYKPSPKTEKAFNTVSEYIANFEQISKSENPSKGVALVGNVGVGKTMLMCAVANHLLTKKISAMFVVAPDLIADLRSAQMSGGGMELEEKVYKLGSIPVLILDDVAKEKPSEWVQTQYFRILDARYRAKLPTLFTSNCSFDEIGEKLGEAVMSRLYALTRGRQVIIAAEDYRITGKWENLYL